MISKNSGKYLAAPVANENSESSYLQEINLDTEKMLSGTRVFASNFDPNPCAMSCSLKWFVSCIKLQHLYKFVYIIYLCVSWCFA